MKCRSGPLRVNDSRAGSGDLMSDISVAFWNKETGNVWAESSDGSTTVEVAAGVSSPLAASVIRRYVETQKER